MTPAAELLCPRCKQPANNHPFVAGCPLTQIRAIHEAQRALGLAELKYLRGQRDAYQILSPGTAATFHMDAARVLDILRLLRVAKSRFPYYGSVKGQKK